ncbi:uncharacterized protein N7518_007423 [Penicillium psychrosexuale]|uniref:uncharacterized protein n=1 Tax=Penicillium psychrosexuale TaxID=1002107 RepID=UPI002545B92F|nr:uncharacterized protein N7518_007423 [Penicillium psychrosexuale]KAJ5790412.1 hypothetical protein N7518_007423 [Penicillium psychrosexuale]
MGRKVQRSLIQLIFFLCILFFILFLNRPQSTKDKLFAWTKVRYQTTSSIIPEARGVCPGLAESTKPALIVSHVSSDGDPSWLEPLRTQYHVCMYQVDAPADKTSKLLQVPANRGHEAMAYLTFLIDNYADIPSAGAVFVHGSRWAWHNDIPDYDNAALLRSLDIHAALKAGYSNLRCDWSAGTCPSSVPAQGSLETRLSSAVSPWSARSASDLALPEALGQIFGGDADARAEEISSAFHLYLGRQDAVRAQCCAQFVVSRERIWQHSQSEYIALRQWLLDGSDDGVSRNVHRESRAAPGDDRIAGRIVSYIWHILFADHAGERGIDLDRLNRDSCPSAAECYCRLYGKCDLKCRGPGSCKGQYSVPKDYRLPEDWEKTHS